MNFFKNSYFVLDEFLRILENSQQVHERFFRILYSFFRILYSFLRISDAVLKNSCMNSWRGGSRTSYEFSEFLRTLTNKLCAHKNSSFFLLFMGFSWMLILTSSWILRITVILFSLLFCPELKKNDVWMKYEHGSNLHLCAPNCRYLMQAHVFYAPLLQQRLWRPVPFT